jgi:ACR3 family arsenite efflux pump ArsB
MLQTGDLLMATTKKLSSRDETKPFILIGAVIVGIILNRLLGAGAKWMMYVVEIGVFFVIFAVMLGVEIKEVTHAFRKVKQTALALVVNFIFIPIFAWAIGWLFLRNQPDFWAGVILYTLTPCIGWYLIFIDLAQGDVAWGMSLLPWNIILQIVLMPVYLYFLVGKVLPLDVSALARSVVLYLFLPFVLAYVVQKFVIARRGREYFFSTVKHWMGEVKLWALVVVIVSMFASVDALGIGDLGRVALIIGVIALFFFSMFLIALLVGRLGKLTYEENTTLAFTTTARNSEAVIGVAVSAFPGHPLVYLAIILGPIVELPMLLLISRILLLFKKKAWLGSSAPAVEIGEPSLKLGGD